MSRLTRKAVHLKTIEKYGELKNINKAIQEFNELIEELRDNKAGSKNHDDIFDEVADCYNMLDKLCVIYGFDKREILTRMNDKMCRTNMRIDIR